MTLRRAALPLALVVLLLPAFAGAPAKAQSTTEADGFVMYANAIPSLDLAPGVARRSGLTRSRNRALLNIAVRRALPEGGDVAVRADISATAINLGGQRQLLALREVREADAIYYLAEPRIAEGEALTFEVDARPEGASTVLQARFRQAFFPPLPR